VEQFLRSVSERELSTSLFNTRHGYSLDQFAAGFRASLSWRLLSSLVGGFWLPGSDIDLLVEWANDEGSWSGKTVHLDITFPGEELATVLVTEADQDSSDYSVPNITLPEDQAGELVGHEGERSFLNGEYLADLFVQYHRIWEGVRTGREDRPESDSVWGISVEAMDNLHTVLWRDRGWLEIPGALSGLEALPSVVPSQLLAERMQEGGRGSHQIDSGV
jgi:hypothetical protein